MVCQFDYSAGICCSRQPVESDFHRLVREHLDEFRSVYHSGSLARVRGVGGDEVEELGSSSCQQNWWCPRIATQHIPVRLCRAAMPGDTQGPWLRWMPNNMAPNADHGDWSVSERKQHKQRYGRGVWTGPILPSF